MNEPIIPEDPSRVTPDNPYGFYSKPIPADYEYEPWTEEEWLRYMAEPPGPSIADIIRELEMSESREVVTT